MNPDNVSSSDEIYRTKTPNKNDVLCGRGGTINSHHGNEQYRSIVESKKRVYLTARFKREKRLIATSIVDQIRKMDPPGRFLQKDADSQTWFDIGEEKAREKTSQALRENSKDVRIQMENEYYEAKREQARQVAIAAGEDPEEAVKGMPMPATSIANAQREKQKHLEEQQHQLAQQQQQIARQQQHLAQQQQQLAQQQYAQQQWNPTGQPPLQQRNQPQVPQSQHQIMPGQHIPHQWPYNTQGPSQLDLQQPTTQEVTAHHGSFYHHQQNPHPQPNPQYSYDHMYGGAVPPSSQKQMMPPPPQQTRIPSPQHGIAAPSPAQQQMMPPPQSRDPPSQDPLAQQQSMFHSGSYPASQPMAPPVSAAEAGVRHVQFQPPAGPGQAHPESTVVGGGIPLLIKPKKRNRSRKPPPGSSNDANYPTPVRGFPPPKPTGAGESELSPDESVASASKSVMSGIMSTKTGDSLSYYLQAMEDEISGDVGQEVELVSHGPSNLPPARSPMRSSRRHARSKNRVPSNSGKIQVDWSMPVSAEGSAIAPSPLASPPSRSPLQNQKYPFSPEHSLDLEKMSLTGTENISQADESIGGASLLNVFNDGPLSPLKPLHHTAMSIGDTSTPVPSLGLSNMGDQDSMMGISVMLDSSVKGMAQHADDQGSVMGASAMSVDSGRISRTSGSRSSSTNDRSASSNRSSSPASFSKTDQVDKQYNPGEAGPNQG
eukprot:CAMPEP_0201729480 /NCGR_PEP_ID=MMETSP0593-20130828/19205_1 /ASSEMBLY_ACC=CAM_ASM_000672 /TAXON_ID=267983 /ORGANISM="Skeletonema japonicum, Strain CCMP2506" /LENGTH=713 /DNA_ID=CAMNT_0048221835 /DNA_START=79 /DNA_END=2216 /DNA_ORIENTATION=-